MSAVLQTVGPDYLRSKFIGGSDIGGILGVSPWSSPVKVYQRKTEAPAEESSGPKMKRYQRGKVWEAVVGEMLVQALEARDHKVKVLSANHRYVDPDIDYFAAEIDYEIKLDDIPDTVNVELKTVHPNAAREWGDAETDEVPTQYAAQAMWGLGITRRNLCIVAPLFGADEIRIYPIQADAEIITGMREQARLFWEVNVLKGVPPQPRTLDDVNTLFKKDAERTCVADRAAIEWLMRYRAVEAEIDARIAERDLLEFHLKGLMQDATALVIPGQEKPAATWKARANAHLDQTALKEQYPKLVQQFTRKGSSRVFDVKNFKQE